MNEVRWGNFLWDVFMCSLGSYGGPEAHYGVFSSILVQKKKYLSEEELSEMIGLFALVPGPSSTQTITAIGYHVGGPILAILTFLVWALPAIVAMGAIGTFFAQIGADYGWKPIMAYLPAAAVAFIAYAALALSKKVIKQRYDVLLFLIMFALGLLLVDYSMWVVPIVLVLGGMASLLPHLKEKNDIRATVKPRWSILALVVCIALINEGLRTWISSPGVLLFTSFYRYGYSVIGGGQIVIPLMIQDLVQARSLISLPDFLSGYAIDQAIPGPLFSFAAFVSSRSFPGTGFTFPAGLIGGLTIFLPGILLVFFIFPLWKSMRAIPSTKHFLSGVSVTAAALIAMTAVVQLWKLSPSLAVYGIVIAGTVALLTKKIPAPLVVILAAAAGFIV